MHSVSKYCYFVSGTCHTYNLDGKEFIETVIAKTLGEHLLNSQRVVILMNLPAMAIEFTETLVGLLGDSTAEFELPPMVYCYCFSKG